jgi:anthranilate 1,2-dioxygenase (deaminating, decarboxylating) large subunit
MSGEKNVEQWKAFIQGCLDFRPAEGVFRIARDIFTEPQLFDLEMELIFEKNWIYASKASWPITTISSRCAPAASR